jgi:predicted house-cleaning noncanonical NTP pyrophosphatase (MazG superfamily)
VKLIRDKLAAEPWAFLPEGRAFVRPVTSRFEHLQLLDRKLLEEAGELITAQGVEQQAAELADVLTVLRSYAELYHIAWSEVERRRESKDAERGMFVSGTVWDI